jgi:hypothetical protein
MATQRIDPHRDVLAIAIEHFRNLWSNRQTARSEVADRPFELLQRHPSDFAVLLNLAVQLALRLGLLGLARPHACTPMVAASQHFTPVLTEPGRAGTGRPPRRGGAVTRGERGYARWQRLNFRPDPHGHGSLRPIFRDVPYSSWIERLS